MKRVMIGGEISDSCCIDVIMIKNDNQTENISLTECTFHSIIVFVSFPRTSHQLL